MDSDQPQTTVSRWDSGALEKLIPLVYDELRRLAAAKMSREQPGQTLQPTALVHEVWLRLGAQNFESRAHFFAAASEAMRRILIEKARRRQSVKHGGGGEKVALDEIALACPAERDEELLEVHEALDALAAVDARKAELVKLRYFVGLPLELAAETLGYSLATAKREWTFARAWLARFITQLPREGGLDAAAEL